MPVPDDEVLRRLAAGETYRTIRKATGATYDQIARLSKPLKAGAKNRRHKSPASPPAATDRHWEEAGDEAKVTAKTAEHIRTEADAIRVCEIDVSRWRVERMTVKAYQGFSKDANDEPVVTQMFSVTLHLKRILSKAMEAATDAVFERFRKWAPVFRPPKAATGPSPMLVVPCLHDVHVGKLGWRGEVGENYDVDIAVRRAANAVDDMLADAVGRPGTSVGEILFVVGSDLVHVDGPDNKTRAGTPQDVDGRYAKVLEATEWLMIEAVHKFAAVARTHVVYVPGNHDTYSGLGVARVLKGVFCRHPGVTVDASPNPRKYHRHGVSLIGLTHGDKLKLTDLPSIMAIERPDDWAATRCRLWLTGHFHHPQKTVTKPADSRFGVEVLTVRSLSGPDRYHHDHGYIGEPKSAEVHYFHPDTGHDGMKIVYARD